MPDEAKYRKMVKCNWRSLKHAYPEGTHNYGDGGSTLMVLPGAVQQLKLLLRLGTMSHF